MSMKKGDIVSGEVIRLDFPNKGIVETNEGDRLTVKNVLPGQEILCRVKKTRKNREEGTPLETTRRSFVEKNQDPCAHFGICGSCLYQSLLYEDELKIKEEQLKRLFIPVIGEEEFNSAYDGFTGSPERCGYRNKMEFSFGDEEKGGPLTLGMHKRGSFYDIVTVSDCRIIDPDMRKILLCTLSYFSGNNVTYRHKSTQEGYLRHLLLRRAVNSKEILMDLVTVSDFSTAYKTDATEKTDEATLLNGWKEEILTLDLEGSIKGILHTKNDSIADVIKDDGTDVLYGEDFFYEELSGLKFKITPFSFFQTNSLGAEVLYKKAGEYLIESLPLEGATNEVVLYDLYSGTGTIAQMMSPYCKKVVGVEIVPEAVEAAKENAGLNGLSNCSFIAGDVLKVLDDINDTHEKPDAIILDPPRDGVHPKALPKILSYGVENLIYISCKPTSLVRDLPVLFEAGYKVKKICGVDMFPFTAGFETVCLLGRRKPDDTIKVSVNMDDYYQIRDAEEAEKNPS